MTTHFQLTECVQSVQAAYSANDNKLIGSEHDLKFANLIADALSDALFLASEVRRLTKEHETINSLTADDLRRKADEMDNPSLAATDTKSVTFVNTGGLNFGADKITIPCNADDVNPIAEAGAHKYQVTIKRLPDTPVAPSAPIVISWTNLTEAQ